MCYYFKTIYPKYYLSIHFRNAVKNDVDKIYVSIQRMSKEDGHMSYNTNFAAASCYYYHYYLLSYCLLLLSTTTAISGTSHISLGSQFRFVFLSQHSSVKYRYNQIWTDLAVLCHTQDCYHLQLLSIQDA